MADELFMDVTKLQAVSGKFGELGNQLTQTSNALKAAVLVLRASAFVGLVGTAVYADYVDNLQGQIEKFANKCKEVSGDLKKSIDAYQKGDLAGSERFY